MIKTSGKKEITNVQQHTVYGNTILPLQQQIGKGQIQNGPDDIDFTEPPQIVLQLCFVFVIIVFTFEIQLTEKQKAARHKEERYRQSGQNLYKDKVAGGIHIQQRPGVNADHQKCTDEFCNIQRVVSFSFHVNHPSLLLKNSHTCCGYLYILGTRCEIQQSVSLFMVCASLLSSSTERTSSPSHPIRVATSPSLTPSSPVISTII